jgi:hypothetical protein
VDDEGALLLRVEDELLRYDEPLLPLLLPEE